jgi:glutamate/aspartate transport system substrate-binding protein
MKKSFVLVAALLAAGVVQASGTLDKIKSSGTITLGVRESSGALGFTLGDGKYVGFHTEMAERISGDLRKKLGLSC